MATIADLSDSCSVVMNEYVNNRGERSLALLRNTRLHDHFLKYAQLEVERSITAGLMFLYVLLERNFVTLPQRGELANVAGAVNVQEGKLIGTAGMPPREAIENFGGQFDGKHAWHETCCLSRNHTMCVEWK
jgi:hypothetical protein